MRGPFAPKNIFFASPKSPGTINNFLNILFTIRSLRPTDLQFVVDSIVPSSSSHIFIVLSKVVFHRLLPDNCLYISNVIKIKIVQEMPTYMKFSVSRLHSSFFLDIIILQCLQILFVFPPWKVESAKHILIEKVDVHYVNKVHLPLGYQLAQ